MKIKTVFNTSAAAFDDEVNAALGEGWQLIRRLSDQPEGFIAELVQLDPEPVPEAQPADPIEALHVIKDACLGVPVEDCGSDRCPLYEWCNQLRSGGDPTDWTLPEKKAPAT